MEIKVKIQNGQLEVEVSKLEAPWILRGYYLYKDGNLIKRVVKDNIDATYQFSLEEDGIYYVKVYTKNGEKMNTTNSNSIAYFTEKQKEKFKKFLKKKMHYKTKCNKRLELYTLEEPFQMFTYVQSKQNVKEGQLLQNLNKNFTQINTRNGILVTDRPTKKIGEAMTIFSGFCKYEKEILIGNEEINEKIDLDLLKESYGNFTLFFENTKKIEIATDYFGTQAIYYYHTEDATIISNEYHLLLIVMKNLGINMKLDMKNVIGNFCLTSRQLFEQRISSKMDIEGIRKLPVEKYIQIDQNGFELKDTSMVQLLKQEFDMNQYEEYLLKAASEIMDNINVVYNSEKFKNVLVDVTGGADSRIVFSAITNIKEGYDKTRIHSNNDSRTKDISVSIPLNNLYNYPYDTLPEIHYSKHYHEGNEIIRSVNMGSYYYIDRYIGKLASNQIVRLMGGGGEVVARPYYSRFLLKEKIGETNDCNEFAHDFFNRRVDKTILGYEDGVNLAEEMLADEISNTIGDTVLEKFENIYMNLRSGIHLNHRANQTASYIEWFPVYSKTTFFLKMKTFHQFKSMKLAMDLIHYFNPVIARIPYEKQMNNEEYERIKNRLAFPDSRYDTIELKMDNDKTKWEEAKKEKEKNRKIVGKKAGQYTREERYKDLVQNFHYLMNQSEEIRDKIGLSIYYWILKNKKTDTNITVLYNKIYSLIIMYIIKILRLTIHNTFI